MAHLGSGMSKTSGNMLQLPRALIRNREALACRSKTGFRTLDFFNKGTYKSSRTNALKQGPANSPVSQMRLATCFGKHTQMPSFAYSLRLPSCCCVRVE